MKIHHIYLLVGILTFLWGILFNTILSPYIKHSRYKDNPNRLEIQRAHFLVSGVLFLLAALITSINDSLFYVYPFIVVMLKEVIVRIYSSTIK